MSDSQIVLSGMRSTGKLHLGHLFGTLHNWVELQEKHRCFFFAADWHALTSDYADPSRVTENTIEALADKNSKGKARKRSNMSPAMRKAVSERMKKYWAGRRKAKNG